jgi:hypothetical protein
MKTPFALFYQHEVFSFVLYDLFLASFLKKEKLVFKYILNYFINKYQNFLNMIYKNHLIKKSLYKK